MMQWMNERTGIRTIVDSNDDGIVKIIQQKDDKLQGRLIADYEYRPEILHHCYAHLRQIQEKPPTPGQIFPEEKCVVHIIPSTPQYNDELVIPQLFEGTQQVVPVSEGNLCYYQLPDKKILTFDKDDVNKTIIALTQQCYDNRGQSAIPWTLYKTYFTNVSETRS